MAKIKSSLPKIISKANREISTIIENDIAKESALLKDLVDQVLAANMEVKKKNNQRITETRRKLQELDIEIDELNKQIDLVDRETVLEQLNEMIDAENKIFEARQEIRFFDNEHIGNRLEQLDDIYKKLAASIVTSKDMEEQYTHLLQSNNDLLFNTQINVTKQIIDLMYSLYEEKRTYVQSQLEQADTIKEQILSKEQDIHQELHDTLSSIRDVQASSNSIFTDVDDDINIGEKITKDHDQTIILISEKKQQLTEKYEAKRQQIIDQYHQYEDSVRQKLVAQNQQAIAEEKAQQDKKEEELKNIRLLIIDAEKKQNFAKVQNLMKQFEKIEKTNVAKVTDRTDRLLQQQTKTTKDKTVKQLVSLNQKFVTDLNKQDLQLSLENIKFEEAKILYKIKSDHEALIGDMTTNKQLLSTIDTFLKTKVKELQALYQLKTDLRIAELEIMKQNELRDIELINQFHELLDEIKTVEQKRLATLLDHSSNHEITKIEQQYHIGKTVLDIQLSKDIYDIDKRILQTRNESLIKVEKMKEDANSEIIYQESLIKIAQKERELQLKKVHSLYENERSLAEEQVERINLGIQVNDTFVKTTLQNQLLFAEQQIQCAKSEFEIRVENVNLTKEQELAYANKKIDYYRQKYEYEKSKINKDLADKLEDLHFKLLLFTDKKENQTIQEQIDLLNERYQAMLDDIEKKEQADPEIKRYETVIEAAERRAQQAINEASALQEQTISAFETLYQQTKLKYQQIETTNHSQDTVGIMPLLNSGAVNSADERLQTAIREAETLYQERVKEPQRIIKETNEQLLAMTQDEETEKFILSQKELKKQKIQEHSNNVQNVIDQREQALAQTTQQIQDQKQSQLDAINILASKVMSEPMHRTDETIVEDYKKLSDKERLHYQQLLSTFTADVQQTIQQHQVILKESNKLIKATIKPYKKYIRRASRGLNAEKREIIRKNKRTLKKALSEALDSFEAGL